MARALLAVLCMAGAAAAQMRGGIAFGGGHAGSPGAMPASPGSLSRGGGPGDFSSRISARHFDRLSFSGVPYFYSDYPYYGNAPNQQPQIIVVEPPTAAPVQVVEDPKPSTPLMIEWRGDRYVRSNESESANVNGRTRRADADDPSPPSPTRSAMIYKATPVRAATGSTAPTAPVLLVFRDGRQQEASSYVIVGGTLYKYADQWAGNAWTQKIQLSDLDLPATARANQTRGVQFNLPQGPNQIIAWP